MKIYKDISAEIPDTNIYSFNLEEWDTGEGPTLCYGYNSAYTYSGEKELLLDIVSPTAYFQKADHFGKPFSEYGKDFKKIFTICPYTAKTVPNMEYVFYPFNKEDIPERQDKLYDVCYFGGIHDDLHQECLDIIRSNFNYRYMTMNRAINNKTVANLRHATSLNLSHKDKIKEVAKCKISVCYNLIPLQPHELFNIKTYSNWQDNEALRMSETHGIAPQFKSRMHEAAMGRTLNLVYKDPWRVGELYYKDDSFVYFESNADLKNKINEILNNWSDYQGMIERAYQTAVNKYTTEHLIKFVESSYADEM